MQIDPIEESTNGYSFATTNSGDPVGFQLPIPVLIQTVAATRGDSSSSLSTVSTGACTEEAGEKLIIDQSPTRSLMQQNLLFIKQKLRRGVEEVVRKESQRIDQKLGHLKHRLQRANQSMERIVSNMKAIEKQRPRVVDQERLDSCQQNASQRPQHTKQGSKHAIKEKMRFDGTGISEEHGRKEFNSGSATASGLEQAVKSQITMEIKHVDSSPLPPNLSDDPYIQEINNDEEYLKTFPETMEQL